MIIKYTKDRREKPKGKDPFLTLQKEYLVLGIVFYPKHVLFEEGFTIDSDDGGSPIVVEMKFFDIIDSRLPEGWCFFSSGDGYCQLEPQEFGGDFWTNYHDGCPESYEMMDDVLRKIHRFHGWPYPEKESERKKTAINYFFDENFDEYGEDEAEKYEQDMKDNDDDKK